MGAEADRLEAVEHAKLLTVAVVPRARVRTGFLARAVNFDVFQDAGSDVVFEVVDAERNVFLFLIGQVVENVRRYSEKLRKIKCWCDRSYVMMFSKQYGTVEI